MPLNFLEWSITLTDLWWAWSTIQITFIFYPYFQLPWALSYCRYKPFINSFKCHLFRYKCWLNYCQQQNIDIPYNLNKIYSARYVSKLFEVVCFYLLTVATCNTYMRMKSCSKLLRILVIELEFNLQIREKL